MFVLTLRPRRLRFRIPAKGIEFNHYYVDSTSIDELLAFAAQKADWPANKLCLKLETLELKARHLKYLQDNDVLDIILFTD